MHGDVEVAARGISIADRVTEVVDVFLDDHRVWSFDPERDGDLSEGVRTVPWPDRLSPFLKGTTTVALRGHVGGRSYFEGDVRFPGGNGARVSVVDRQGHRLAVDKSGRLQRSFSGADEALRGAIMDGVERALRDLRDECGLDAFLAYGCLLGAVRTGHMIGHDSDVDLSYLSKLTHPLDLIRESQRAARQMRSKGWSVVQMSGGTFKLWLTLENGTRVGVDVFASFYVNGVFHLVPTVRGELPRSSLVPTSTVTLEGRTVPAPAKPEDWLAITYGPRWRTPDPAFKFQPPVEMARRVNGWFRDTRTNVRHWHDFYRSPSSRRVPHEPSLFATWVGAQLPGGHSIADVGTGNGRDALWLAAQGHQVLALDRDVNARRRTRSQARRRGLPVTTERLNLNELNDVLVSGARRAHCEGVHHTYARFLLDTLQDSARHNFWRWAQMTQRRGGLTFLEFRTDQSATEPTAFPDHPRRFLPPDRVVGEVEARGGVVVRREEGRDLAPFEDENPHVCRLVVRWKS